MILSSTIFSLFGKNCSILVFIKTFHIYKTLLGTKFLCSVCETNHVLTQIIHQLYQRFLTSFDRNLVKIDFQEQHVVKMILSLRNFQLCLSRKTFYSSILSSHIVFVFMQYYIFTLSVILSIQLSFLSFLFPSSQI
jgi:hypothetical protein